MSALVIALTITAFVGCLTFFLIMLLGGFILLKLKKLSKKDFKFFVKIKAIAFSLTFILGWVMGFIAILVTR